MAILHTCAIFDEKAEVFVHNQQFLTIGMAHRDFLDTIESDERMKKHATDFKMYHLANFDNVSGLYDNVVPPRLVAAGSDVGSNGI